MEKIQNLVKYLHKYLGLILFVLVLLVALFTYSEYGISWDEGTQHKLGTVFYQYVRYGNQEYLEWPDRDYGVSFEFLLIIIEKVFDLEDSRSVSLSRHLVTHFFYLISAYFGFLLIDFLYENKILASIGFLMIIINPRIYSHSFFNTKDIPFMAMYMICLYIIAIAFKKKKKILFIVLGTGVGLLVSLRIMGVLLFGLVLLLFGIDLVLGKDFKKYLVLSIFFIVSTFIALYIFWPHLWQNPLDSLINAVVNISKARYKNRVLFNGQLINANELGWDYIPTWFSITTPVLYLLGGIFGVIIFARNFCIDPILYLSNSTRRNNLIFLISFIFPVLSVIVTQAVLYDGWRHLYFIYPSFVLLCIYGFNYLLDLKLEKLIVFVSLISFTITSIIMINNYPLQYIYFNKLVDTETPEYLRKHYELDYWGISYKQSLEYILEHDSSSIINVAAEHKPGRYNLRIIPVGDRSRVNIVEPEEATYFITNYRLHPQSYESLTQKEWHSIKIGNNTVSTIFKLR